MNVYSVQKLRHAKWAIFPLGASLVLFGVGFSLLHKTSPAETQTHFISLSEEGFYPKELTIREGDTVVFSTERGEYFWPASNIHPVHERYPEFDPRGPIAPQKTWSFSFNKAGTWEYHDHLYPFFLGKIHVLP